MLLITCLIISLRSYNYVQYNIVRPSFSSSSFLIITMSSPSGTSIMFQDPDSLWSQENESVCLNRILFLFLIINKVHLRLLKVPFLTLPPIQERTYELFFSRLLMILFSFHPLKYTSWLK